jgi:hypothetical protein
MSLKFLFNSSTGGTLPTLSFCTCALAADNFSLTQLPQNENRAGHRDPWTWQLWKKENPTLRWGCALRVQNKSPS